MKSVIGINIAENAMRRTSSPGSLNASKISSFNLSSPIISYYAGIKII
jgi:hypothetical protein